jgi:hypothetical protein
LRSGQWVFKYRLSPLTRIPSTPGPPLLATTCFIACSRFSFRTTSSITIVTAGSGSVSAAVAWRTVAPGLSEPGSRSQSNRSCCVSTTTKPAGRPLLDSFGPSDRSAVLLWPRLTSAAPSSFLAEAVVPFGRDGRSPRVRTSTFAPHPPHLPKSVVMATDFVQSRELIVALRPPMRFVFLGSWLRLRLPSDPTSRWTPLPFG